MTAAGPVNRSAARPTRPFRFGVGPGAIRVESARDWSAFARRVEDLGYSTLSVGDHLVGSHGPVAALAAAAAATSRLRIGALTFCNDYFHPVRLAQEAATLDLLSDGRLEFGIGAGWMRADYDRSGIPFDSAAVRIERMGEAIAVIKRLWADGPCSFEGTHYRVALDGRPKPVQRPRPPILVGGAGERVLAVAAREADIVGLNVSLRSGSLDAGIGLTGTLAATREKVAHVERLAAGRPPVEVQIYVHHTVVGPNGRRVLEDAAAAFGLDPAEAAASPHVLAGSATEVVERLEERREALGISYVSVSAEAVDQFAPVVARLRGR